jgi:hypothetical protein
MKCRALGKLSLLIGTISLLTATATHALQLGFENISGNNAVNAAVGEAQLSVQVTDASPNQVLFTFKNTGPIASSITDVYFDNGVSLSNIALFISSSGVSFSQGASPGNLPGGSGLTPPFIATPALSADSNSSTIANGVNPGEWLGMLFNLDSSSTYASVLNELYTGELRIGLHVQSIGDGGSESFINTTPTPDPVPEPGTVVLLGSGLVGLGLYHWRRKRTEKAGG